MREKKGQSATELLVLAGFSVAFILPLVFLFMSSSNSELGKTAFSQAKATTRTIADEAGEIYLQGYGAKKTILVNYPQGVINGSAENGVVALTVDADGRRVDVLSATFAPLKGNLSGRRTAGLQRIKIENMGDYVNVTYG
ncbi:MAG: hypothetical protein N3E51_01130 [Candidatus Micrarchaeota archaeon]|nr:hypothetical protein [Candidatus Micrarchaeota archaeon]